MIAFFNFVFIVIPMEKSNSATQPQPSLRAEVPTPCTAAALWRDAFLWLAEDSR